MFEAIDHVGIAVADVDAAVAHYTALLGRAPAHREIVARDGIEAVMFQLEGSRVELLGAARPDSAIAGFLERRGGGLHHVAYRVSDIAAALDHCRALGLQLLDDCPRQGAAGRLVAFLHPGAGLGALTELCAPAEQVG